MGTRQRVESIVEVMLMSSSTSDGRINSAGPVSRRWGPNASVCERGRFLRVKTSH